MASFLGEPSATNISVVTVTWNCAHTILDCLSSVEKQTYPSIEHVVVDGASTDATVDFLESHRSKLGVFVSEPDRGIYDALNKGISLASGDIVGFLHADDIYASDDVLAGVASAFEDPSVQAVYGDLQYVRADDVNSVVRHWQSRQYTPSMLARGWMPAHPTLYVRREWYERIGGFNIQYRIAADYLSILQLFSQPEFKAVYLPQVLVKMRVGGASNRSLRNIIQKSREDYRALRTTGVGGIGTLAMKNFSKLGQFLPWTRLLRDRD